MKIRNFDALAKTHLRRLALEIAEIGLHAIDTKKVIQKNVRVEDNELFVAQEKIPLKSIKRIFVVGVGKCSLEAGAALEKILGERINGGIILDVREGKLQRIRTFTGTHPLPSIQNINATRQIIFLLSELKKDDLVIFIISGGGSTLLCQPLNLTYEDEAVLLKHLFKVGADIYETNTIRKHLSLARGGYLAKYAYPAKVISLIFSDVPGNKLEFVASGPTIKDTTTVKDAEKITKKYDLEKKCNFKTRELIETPKDKKYFENVKNILMVSNKIALEAMAKKAVEFDFKPKIVTANLTGEARDVGREIARHLNKIGSKNILLYGGETTVTIKNQGRGGRIQELCLSALRFIKEGRIIIGVASDGRDNTEFAGAIADALTKENAKNVGLDPEKHLEENDSYNFFSKTGDFVLTGDTGSNVSDLIIAIKD